MKKGKTLALVALGLTAGLVLGSVGVSYAATDTESTSPVVCAGARMGQSIRDAGARLIDIVADLTGLSVEDVQAERAEGASVADIAEANGVATEDIIAKALDERKAILDAKVADGTIPQERADLAYDRMTERLSDRVTTDETGRPEWAGLGGGMGGGQGGRGGMGSGGGQGGMGLRDGSCATTL